LGAKKTILLPTFFLLNVAPHTPVENLKTAVAAARIYGAVGADADTPFEIPKLDQIFEEFLINKLKNNTEQYSFDWLSKSGLSYLEK